MNSASQRTRTSMALDAGTLRALKDLSEKWRISKAEVIRRAVRQLNDKAEQEDRATAPLEALDWLQQGGGLVTADEVRSGKSSDRVRRPAEVSTHRPQQPGTGFGTLAFRSAAHRLAVASSSPARPSAMAWRVSESCFSTTATSRAL